MRPVTWSPVAVRDVRRIQVYIAQFNPAAGAQLAAELIQATDLLERYPYAARAVAHGRRELVHTPYVIVYRVRPAETRILRVWHGAQNRQRS